MCPGVIWLNSPVEMHGQEQGLYPSVPRFTKPWGRPGAPHLPQHGRAKGRPWARTKPGLRGLQPPWDKLGTNPLAERSSRRCPEVSFILTALGWAKPPPQGDFRDTCSAFEVKRGLLEEGLESYCTGQGCAPARPQAQGHAAKLLCFAQVPRNCWGQVSELNYTRTWASASPELLQHLGCSVLITLVQPPPSGTNRDFGATG